jgi:hypothetical protein
MSDGVLLCLVDVFVVYLRGRNEIGAPRREGGREGEWMGGCGGGCPCLQTFVG